MFQGNQRTVGRALLVVLTLFVALGPLAEAVLADEGEEERWELVDERDVFTKVFESPDGTVTLHMGADPLHYQPAGDERYEDIDPTLVYDEGWRNETNSFPIRLPYQLGDGSTIELGSELGIRWLPGHLKARLLSGLEVDMAEPMAAPGSPSEEHDNAIVYRDLYPGMDLEASVSRGSLTLVLVYREWSMPFAPEQIAQLFIEAQVDVAPELFEAAWDRESQGEPVEEIPIFFGRAQDEWVISVFGEPGVPEPELEEYAGALSKGEHEEGGAVVGPSWWRSELFFLLNEGRVRHFLSLPKASTTASALTAKFQLTARSFVDQLRYFGASQKTLPNGGLGASNGPGPFTVRCDETTLECRSLYYQMIAAKGDGFFLRTAVPFVKPDLAGQGWRSLLADPANEIVSISLGMGPKVSLPGDGVVAIDRDTIIAYSILPFTKKSASGGVSFNGELPPVFSRPYNQEARTVTGGTIKTSTWSPLSTQGPRTVTIGGQNFLFGELSSRTPGSQIPSAIQDFKASVDDGLGFSLLLAQPYDRTSCPECTANSPNAAVRALNGEYRVGAAFQDLRLEVRLRTTTAPTQTAQITATSVGGHNDRLYPGETLSWDLELASFSGPADTLELREVPWPASHFDVWYTQPATGAVVDPPTLSQVGDRVRVNLRSKVAYTSLYGTNRLFSIGGFFQNTKRSSEGRVRIPVYFQPPEAQPSFTQINATFDRTTQTTRQVLATLTLPQQGLRATVFAEPALKLVSGARRAIYEGHHWSRGLSLVNSPGPVYIHPWDLPKGTYTVELTPCLYPDGAGGVDPTCLSASARQMTFEVIESTPPPPPKPAIDFVTPWSVDSPSGGAIMVSIFGKDVGGGVAGTSVTIPQVVSGASPLLGSTASQVNVSVNVGAGTACGPRQLTLTTAGGSDTASFNVTRPFQGSPHHFVVEAETGDLNGTALVNLAGASGGKAVGLATPGTPGEMTLRFRVPATSSSYQLYTLYSTPEANAARADLTISSGGSPVKFYRVAMGQTAAGEFKLAPLYDSTQAGPPTLLSLQAGTTYELKIAARAGQRYPLLDLLVLSDGSLPPTLAELCR